MRPAPPIELCAALAALALMGGGRPGRAEEPVIAGAGGALAISAEPAELVLGKDAGAELRIGAPPEVEELAVTASAGKVEGLRRLPGGGFTARYRPPPERYPQVAILSAVGRAGAATLDGWLAVPLAGQGEARVPGTPGAEVSLRVGDRSFGPGRVGDDGIAAIPVVVPPGVQEGHQGFTAVALRIPETSLLHAAADRHTVQADRAESVRVFAYVVAPHGAARAGTAPEVQVTRGALALRPREAGAWAGTWVLPPGPAGEERATLRLEGAPASRAELRVRAVAGAVAAVALTVDRAALAAGDAGVEITARALDAAGNPAAAMPVLSADAGALTDQQAGPGLARARLRVGPSFEGRGQVVVAARVPGTDAQAVQAVPLLAGPAARARLSPRRAVLRGDGRGAAVLRLEVWDAFRNPVAGSPFVTLDPGGAATLEPDGKGRWAIRVRPEAVAGPTTVRLAAGLGAARDEAELLVVPSPSAQLGLLAAGGGMAGLHNGGSGGLLLVGAELPLPDVPVLPIDRALALRLELVGLQARRSRGAGDQTQRAVLALGGPVVKGLLPGAGARWFASATGGLLVGTADERGRPARAGVGLAGRLALGMAFPVRRTAPFLEVAWLGAGGPGGGSNALMLSFGVRADMVRDLPGSGD